jgi:TIGR00159 family protein
MFTTQSWDYEFLLRLAVQVVIISYALAWGWQRIAGSQAERLVKGVLVLAAIWAIASALKFQLITSLLHTFVPVALIGLVIIFQPELRRGLGHLGRMRTFRFDWSLADADYERTVRDIDHIINAIRELSRSKTGALIVIEPLEGERDYVSPGTTVNADISSTLLLTIFFGNSPLHDGAVIIRETKIVAAGVILPMTEDPQLSYRYGTRHRAAIGLSEMYDGLCIVVSEETGAISASSRGMLARYKNADDLKEPILYLYTQGGDSKNPNPLGNFLSLFTMGRKDADVVDEDEGTGEHEALTKEQLAESGGYAAIQMKDGKPRSKVGRGSREHQIYSAGSTKSTKQNKARTKSDTTKNKTIRPQLAEDEGDDYRRSTTNSSSSEDEMAEEVSSGSVG